MRVVKTHQLNFGGVNISDINIDPRSRDDIPRFSEDYNIFMSPKT